MTTTTTIEAAEVLEEEELVNCIVDGKLVCTFQDSVGEFGTVIQMSKQSENMDFRQRTTRRMGLAQSWRKRFCKKGNAAQLVLKVSQIFQR